MTNWEYTGLFNSFGKFVFLEGYGFGVMPKYNRGNLSFMVEGKWLSSDNTQPLLFVVFSAFQRYACGDFMSTYAFILAFLCHCCSFFAQNYAL